MGNLKKVISLGNIKIDSKNSRSLNQKSKWISNRKSKKL